MDKILSKSEIFEFSGGQKPSIRGVTCDLRSPFSNLAELFQPKVMYEDLVRIGWAFRELSFEFSGEGAETPYYGGYMWPAMPIFEFGRAIPVKSHVWTFGSDWLSLSRVIVSTNIFPEGGGEAETPY